MTSVQSTAPQLWRKLEKVKKKQIPKIIGRSMDETLRAARKVGSQTITARINLKSAVVKRDLKGSRSRDIGSLDALAHGRLFIELSAVGRPVALKDYAARSTKGGATYLVRKGAVRKIYKRLGKAAFVSPAIGGHVFVRTGPNPRGPKNAPIKKVFGPSLPQYFVSRVVKQHIKDAVRDVWPRAVTRNANFYLQVQP